MSSTDVLGVHRLTIPLLTPIHTLRDVSIPDGLEDSSDEYSPDEVWTKNPDDGTVHDMALAWDIPACRPATRGAFLSEQPARVFVASRYHVQPRLESESSAERRFISPSDLLASLRTTLLGTASPLFGWHEPSATFFVRSAKAGTGKPGDTLLVLGELSEEATMSLVQPCMHIGTLLCRLDHAVASLQSPSSTPAARALAHSLQSLIQLIQSELSARLPQTLAVTALVRLSTLLNDIRFELDALAELCLCPLDESPPFVKLPATRIELFDHLFLALEHAFRHSAPYRIPAILVHLFTVSSQDFDNALASAIGLAPQSLHPSKSLVEGERVRLPSFLTPQARVVLENAARALVVLQRADPGHPLCKRELWSWNGPDWGWSDKDLHDIDIRTQKHIQLIKRALAAWYDPTTKAIDAYELDSDSSSAHEVDQTNSAPPDDETVAIPRVQRAYKPEIQAIFSVFDQPPGSHIPSSAKGAMDGRLIANGPTSLPFTSPTLSLTIGSSLLALPLAHSRLINSALLRVFTQRLAFGTHLKVVRGFLLGGDQNFWSRLRDALFEDSAISDVSANVGRGIRAGVRARLGIVDPVRDHIADKRAEREGRVREWGVGLAVGLSDRDGVGTWPPGGAELGLRLRHVIDDTLNAGWGTALTDESDNEPENSHADQDKMVLKETSWRLGFILRDLEEESAEGRARWLDPNAIEALDFLCLDYNPPDPIDIILTSDIRQKMHRVFTFLLRLLRVETVTKMLFNTTFHSTSNYPPVVLLARFKMQSFVSSLVGYITDIAVGANWNSFLAALDKIQHDGEDFGEPTPRRDPKNDQPASDIFAVHAHLSTTLDRILEACLLRVRQRGVGNALKECMEAVLVLGKLVGDWCRETPPESRTKQKHFVVNVTRVLQRFDRLYVALVTALRALDLKGGTSAERGYVSSEDTQLLRRLEGENKSSYGQMATWLDPIGRCVKARPVA